MLTATPSICTEAEDDREPPRIGPKDRSIVPGSPGRAICAGGLGGDVLRGVARFDVVALGSPKENASGVGNAGARSGRRSGRGGPVDGPVDGVARGVSGAGVVGTGGGRGITIANGAGAGAGTGGGSGRLVSGGAGAGCASADADAGAGGAGGGGGGRIASVGGATGGAVGAVGGVAGAAGEGGIGGTVTPGAGDPGCDRSLLFGLGPELSVGECPSNTMAKSAGGTCSA